MYKIINMYLNSISNKNNVGRPNKMNNKHYIDNILHVLKTGIQWKEIKSTLHYTTYHKKFISWNNNKVFQNVFYILIKLLKLKNKINEQVIKDLYIDSTMIKNNRGIDLLGPNHYDRFRKGNKISIVVTNTGIPLGMTINKSNVHDINLVEDNLDDITIKIVNSRLGGDKGYNSAKLKNNLNTKNISLVYYPKKNSNIILSNEDKTFLRKRYIVENTFSWLKNNKRLSNRYDANSNNFIQFWYLGFIKLITNRYNKITLSNFEFNNINYL